MLDIQGIKMMAMSMGVPVDGGNTGEGEPLKYAIVRESDRTIVNFIMLRANSPWEAPEGHTAYQVPDGFVPDIGWCEKDRQWYPPAIRDDTVP